MKFLFLLASFLMLSYTDYAQQALKVEKWFVSRYYSTDTNSVTNDLLRQIKILDITKSVDNNTYSGTVDYGNSSTTLTEICNIKITSNYISITTDKETWLGEIQETGDDRIVIKLGAVLYYFKLLTNQQQPIKSKTTYTKVQFKGNWVETERVDYTKNVHKIITNDSIYLHFTNDSAIYLTGTRRLPVYGTFFLTHGNNLNVSKRDFKVISITDQMMVLDDYNNIIHTFIHTSTPFFFEINKQLIPKVDIDLTPKSLIKNWFVYSLSTPISVENDNALSTLNILEQNSETSYSGTVEFGDWKKNSYKTLPCKITFSENNLRIESEEFNLTGKIFKANGDTIIFGKVKNLIYCLKKIETINNLNIESETSVIQLTPASLIKNWSVLQAEFEPGTKTTETGVLIELNIERELEIQKYKGMVTFDHRGKRLIQDCTLQFTGDLKTGAWVNIATKGYNWRIEVIKADADKLILGGKVDKVRYNFINE